MSTYAARTMIKKDGTDASIVSACLHLHSVQRRQIIYVVLHLRFSLEAMSGREWRVKEALAPTSSLTRVAGLPSCTHLAYNFAVRQVSR
jgi:hypothetical protein